MTTHMAAQSTETWTRPSWFICPLLHLPAKHKSVPTRPDLLCGCFLLCEVELAGSAHRCCEGGMPGTWGRREAVTRSYYYHLLPSSALSLPHCARDLDAVRTMDSEHKLGFSLLGDKTCPISQRKDAVSRAGIGRRPGARRSCNLCSTIMGPGRGGPARVVLMHSPWFREERRRGYQRTDTEEAGRNWSFSSLWRKERPLGGEAR